MQFPILIEPTSDGRFRAKLGEPFLLSAVADEAESAVHDLVGQVQQRLRAGARVAVLTMTNGSMQAGMAPLPADEAYKTDWVYQALTDEMAEKRRLEESAGT